MNLLMVAPLSDSRGKIRYFIGAQVDVSGLVGDCSDLESLRRLVIRTDGPQTQLGEIEQEEQKDELQELSEMLNLQELETIRRWGGRMRKDTYEAPFTNFKNAVQPRLHIESPDGFLPGSGKLSGIYENYLLMVSSCESGQVLTWGLLVFKRFIRIHSDRRSSVSICTDSFQRPFPSLRILFASPSLRVPGILQSPFMAKVSHLI